jgi:hypothetical protein
MKKINIKVFLVGLFLFLIAVFLFFTLTKKNKSLVKIETSGCKKSGCSNQLCVSSEEKDIITTCQWQEEYACYQQAKCEIQPNGKCGFTPDEKLLNCLGNLAPKIQKVELK